MQNVAVDAMTDRAQTLEPVDSIESETRRIMSSSTIWVAAGVIAPILGLAPLVSAGWSPAALPPFAALLWWLGAASAGIGLALLIWAACPVLGFPLEEAYKQKVFCCRVGIAMNVAGIAFAGLVILVTPLALTR